MKFVKNCSSKVYLHCDLNIVYMYRELVILLVVAYFNDGILFHKLAAYDQRLYSILVGIQWLCMCTRNVDVIVHVCIMLSAFRP